MTCKNCKNTLTAAERYGGNTLCDRCRVQASLLEKKKEAMRDNLDTIPLEYRGTKKAQVVKSNLKYPGDIWENNTYIAGRRADVTSVKYAIAEHIWKSLHSARIVNFLAWIQEYSAKGDDKWSMLRDVSVYGGYIIIDADNLCGITDQSVLYTILKNRQDKGLRTCLMVSSVERDELARTLASHIEEFVKDPTNKYTGFMLY